MTPDKTLLLANILETNFAEIMFRKNRKKLDLLNEK